MHSRNSAADIGQSLPSLQVGHLTVPQLREALEQANIGLNEHAQTLLDRPEMAIEEQIVDIGAVTPADLGFAEGLALTDFFDAAIDQGLQLCPLATGPYLRLVYSEAESTDPELRRHRPPEGSLHIASPMIAPSFETPKGFYLRTVEGQQWLRGYRCDDDYVIPADAVHIFRRNPQG